MRPTRASPILQYLLVVFFSLLLIQIFLSECQTFLSDCQTFCVILSDSQTFIE